MSNHSTKASSVETKEETAIDVMDKKESKPTSAGADADDKKFKDDGISDEASIRSSNVKTSARIMASGVPAKKTISPVDTLEERVRNYCKSMAPNIQQDKESLRRNQLELINILDTLLRYSSSIFPQGMNAVLRVASEYRNEAFHDRYIARGFNGIQDEGIIDLDKRMAIENFLSLITTSCDSKDPRVISDKIDLTQVVRRLSDESSNKITTYFK